MLVVFSIAHIKNNDFGFIFANEVNSRQMLDEFTQKFNL